MVDDDKLTEADMADPVLANLVILQHSLATEGRGAEAKAMIGPAITRLLTYKRDAED